MSQRLRSTLVRDSGRLVMPRTRCRLRLVALLVLLATLLLHASLGAQSRNPANIEGEIRTIDAPREPLAPLPGLDEFFQPWYDFKSDLATNYGINFGIAWTPLYQVATKSLTGDNEAAGGIFEILGRWTLFDRKGDHPGWIGLRVENRHAIGTSFPPQSLFANLGAATPTAIGFSEFDLTVAELYFEVDIIKDRFAVRGGKVLPFAMYDFFLFKNPKTDYLNANFALNPTIAWPQFGLGAATEVRPWPDIYVLAGIHDANGSPTDAGFDTFFGEREFFVVADVGWDPGFLVDGETNPLAPDVHATFWHTDARKAAGRPEGWGASLTAQKAWGRVVPFARYGYSDGGAALLEHLVMVGVNWLDVFNFQHDSIGLAFSYARPSAGGSRDQYTSELYYRTQVTRRLALSPSVQLLANPAAHPDQDVIAVFGFRARLDF